MSILERDLASLIKFFFNRMESRRRRKKYHKDRGRSVASIKKLDSILINDDTSEIRLFAILRNEALRLPYFIDYYKALGIDRFIMLDNGSTDNSLEILQRYDGLHIFQTSDNYKNHWYWMEYLLETYGIGNWCVVVDIDELFTYPLAEVVDLHQLKSYLEQNGDEAVHSLLLDMYSSKGISTSDFLSDGDPLAVLDHFDSRHSVVPFWFFDNSRWCSYPFEIFTGGMRDRVFGKSDPPSILSKIPFFKNKLGVYLSQGMHAINGATVSEIQGVVFHTKFSSDFINEVQEECKRKVHYGNAFYYERYKNKLDTQPALSLFHPESVHFLSGSQLTHLNLMKSSSHFDSYVHNLLNTR